MLVKEGVAYFDAEQNSVLLSRRYGTVLLHHVDSVSSVTDLTSLHPNMD